MFSRWIVTNITFVRGTLHCRKTRIPCGDQIVICGLYTVLLPRKLVIIHLCRRENLKSNIIRLFYIMQHINVSL
jgi:hypothetical protein